MNAFLCASETYWLGGERIASVVKWLLFAAFGSRPKFVLCILFVFSTLILSVLRYLRRVIDHPSLTAVLKIVRSVAQHPVLLNRITSSVCILFYISFYNLIYTLACHAFAFISISDTKNKKNNEFYRFYVLFSTRTSGCTDYQSFRARPSGVSY